MNQDRDLRGRDSPQLLLLSVDFEDWHQLVRRRVGVRDWKRPGPALARQTEATLALLEELGGRATFFVLGMTARAHPQLIERIADRGHEIACHGDAHLPVHRQSRDEFGADLCAARETIERLTGRSPLGYRAPAFSITAQTDWVYEVLAEQGFAYDASQHDSPRIRDRLSPSRQAPHEIELAGGRTMWEFPVAVWHSRYGRLPVGGASYWALLPKALILQGLERAGPLGGLYLHPYELDPEPLDPQLPDSNPPTRRAHAMLRAAQRNTARRRAPAVMRAIGRRFRLIPYGEAHARLGGGATARS